MLYLNGKISLVQARTAKGWKGRVRLFNGDTLIDERHTEVFTGENAKKDALQAASKLRDKLEELGSCPY